MRLTLLSKVFLCCFVLFTATSLFGQQPILYLKAKPNATWKAFDQGFPADATVSGVAEIGNTLIISTDFHGIYKRSFVQVSWIKVGFSLPSNVDINAIEAFGNRLVIGTYKNGIWYSNDHGKTWFPSIKQPKNLPIRALLNTGEYLLAGTDRGIYKSNDAGNTWDHLAVEKQVLGFAQSEDLTYVALQDGAASLNEGGGLSYIYKKDALHDIAYFNHHVFAFTLGRGLLKAKENTPAWQKIQAGMGPDNLYIFEWKASEGVIYAAQWHGVYSTRNQGLNWFVVNGLPQSLAFGLLKKTEMGLLAAVAMR